MSKLKELSFEMNESEKRIVDIKRLISELTARTEYTQEEIDFFYWETDLPVSLILKDIPNSQFVKMMKPNPCCVEICCDECGTQYDVYANSREEKKSYSRKKTTKLCSSCFDLKSKESEKQFLKRCEERIKKEEELKLLKTMPYSEYLRSDHWIEFRKKVLRRYDYKCQLCHKDGSTMHVHHNNYKRRGEESYTDVILLCADCHHKHHNKCGDAQ